MKNQNEFLGGIMSQTPDTPKVFSKLLEKMRPQQIIEIGTFKGGLTCLLGLYGLIHRCDVYTFDSGTARTYAHNSIPHHAFDMLSIEFLPYDVFTRVGEIGEQLIQLNGPTLLLCDGGNKPREFNTFAKYLKPGDVIMAHDYSRSPDHFEEEQKKRWRWAHEIMDHHISETVEKCGLKPHPMYDEFCREAWLCMVKPCT